MKKIEPGVRFDISKREFIYNSIWEEEDKREDPEERTKREILCAMNSVNSDLKFTLETEKDFQTKRLPTLSFEIWSCADGIHHSYYEKEMRNQILTMKRSAQSENSKNAILTNELNRRFLMMDRSITSEERREKVDHFTRQLVNSGYSWTQCREIVICALKGILKKEMNEKASGANRYKTGEQSLEERLKKHLVEATEWYKKGRREEEEEEGGRIPEEKSEQRAWKGWRIGRKMGRKITDMSEKEQIVKGGLIKGVLFLPYTVNSELAKRVKEKLKQLEDLSSLRIRVVERTGEKLVDCLHKSNPWVATDCEREGCQFCMEEKTRGKCKSTGIVYEIECITCKKKIECCMKEEEIKDRENEEEEVAGEKRKRSTERDDRERESRGGEERDQI